MQSSLLWCFSSARAKLSFAHSLESHLEYPKLGKKKCKRKRSVKGVSSHSLTKQFDRGFPETFTNSANLRKDNLKKNVYNDTNSELFKEELVVCGLKKPQTKIWQTFERVFHSSRCLKCHGCSTCFVQWEAACFKGSHSQSSCWRPGFSSCFSQQSFTCCVFRSFENRWTCYNRLLPSPGNREWKSCWGSGSFLQSNVSSPVVFHQLCHLFHPSTNSDIYTRKLFPLMYAVYMSQYPTSPSSNHNWKEEGRYSHYFTAKGKELSSNHHTLDSNGVLLTSQANPYHSFSSSSDKIRRLAVISDIHVFDVDGFWNENVLEFFNLRILGLLNILFLRGPERFSVQVLAKAVEDMHEMKIDHLILAGDITNLSLESEFATASKVIRLFGPPSTITAIPGNHDVYNRGELKRKLFQKYFGSYAVSDIPGNSPRGDGFPILQRRGNVALIGLNTALPGSARGMVGRRQWHAVEELMGRASHILNNVDLKVLVLHHPAQNPMVRGLPWIREIGHDLKDWKSVAQFCRKYSIDLVVHGHNHVPYQGLLDGSPHTLVCESGSGTLMTYQEDRVARYTVFELNEKGVLERSFARVWDIQGDCFRTKELILPPIEKQKSVPFAAT